jgi:hypothetical protein
MATLPTPLLSAVNPANGAGLFVNVSVKHEAHSTVKDDPGSSPSARNTPFDSIETTISAAIDPAAQHSANSVIMYFFTCYPPLS